ncbi:hypothetical protein ACJMK2_022682, partial [Sinanodonta woodiana]
MCLDNIPDYDGLCGFLSPDNLDNIRIIMVYVDFSFWTIFHTKMVSVDSFIWTIYNILMVYFGRLYLDDISDYN